MGRSDSSSNRNCCLVPNGVSCNSFELSTKRKRAAEFIVEGFGIVTYYIEAAAFRRALWSKGSGPGGRRFKSSRPDHSFQEVISNSWFFVYSTVDDFVDKRSSSMRPLV